MDIRQGLSCWRFEMSKVEQYIHSECEKCGEDVFGTLLFSEDEDIIEVEFECHCGEVWVETNGMR